MGTSLFEMIQAQYEQEPDDPFNIYVLALEYLKVDLSEAQTLFDRLLSEYPDYLATYYHAAGLQVELENFQRASEIYEEGIKVAGIQNNTKTKGELLNAYRNLQDEMDE